MKKVDLLGIAVSIGAYDDFVGGILRSAKENTGGYTCIANVHMLVEAHLDLAFADVVSNARVITPDGKPLAWALRLLYGIRQDRVAGMDLLPDLLEEASLQQLPVYFYGGSPQLLEQTRKYLSGKFPHLIIAGYKSPPYRALTAEEDEQVIDEINASGARLVFVVLGCPKQEKWMAAMEGRVQAATVGIGGALPVMVGLQKRAPSWMQRAGLEWLFRLVQEPSRLFKRYAITNTFFIYLLFRAFVAKIFRHPFVVLRAFPVWPKFSATKAQRNTKMKP